MEENIIVNEEEKGLEQESPKTFTQEDVMKMIQQESDRRITQLQKKHEKEMAKNKTLSGLDETQRALAEKDMRLQELEDKLREFNLMQTKSEISKVLSARGLSSELVDFVCVTDDVDDCQAKIDTLDKIIKAEIKKEVERRMGSSTPKTSTIGLTEGMTKDKFNQLNDNEKIAFLMENPEFFK